MAEIHAGGSHGTTKSVVSIGKLRSLARPGFQLKPFLKSVTPLEIGALLGMIILIATVIVTYSFGILPDQVRYVQLTGQFADNEKRIAELQGQLADPREITSSFELVRDSLDSFRTDVLKPRLAGRIDIIDTVSALTKETGVRLAGPVQFLSSEQPAVDDISTDTSSTGSRKRNVARPAKDVNAVTAFPSMQMTFSVSGSYAQLRSFLSKFEKSSQFVIIDTVALNAGETPAGGDTPRGARASAASPESVTLDIAVTTYFRPDQMPAGAATAPAAAPPAAQ